MKGFSCRPAGRCSHAALRRLVSLPRCVPSLEASCLLLSCRLCSSSSSSASGRIEPEMITIDAVEVEQIEHAADPHLLFTPVSHSATTTYGSSSSAHLRPEAATTNTDSSTASRLTATAAAATPSAPATTFHERWHHELRNAAYWDVTQVDAFARSRVTNFVRRAGDARQNIFDVREDMMSGRRVFVATCRLTLPDPHRSYVAEGVAENAKDAELLAAMHGERVCDALGVPLFRLPSTQRRHAESARAEGRYAPMPEDPVRSEGTPVPPPLRMVLGLGGGSTSPRHPADGGPGTTSASGHGPAFTDAARQAEEAKPRGHTPLFSTSVAEAILVDPLPPLDGASAAATAARTAISSGGPSPSSSLFGGSHDRPAAAPAPTTTTWEGSSSSSSSTDAVQHFRDAIWYPWTEAQRHNPLPTTSAMTMAPATAASAAAPGPAVDAAATFDPTEGGHWAMVTTASTRCSPAPLDAVVLSCVYEPAALERIKEFFLHHHQSWKEHVATSSVIVPGSPTRMYVVELRLPVDGSSTTGGVVMARGKAQTTEVATVLAAMHAELLLDALGLPLFPKDDARQARHARAAAGFGRWAPNPVTGDTTAPTEVQHAALPRPLKQQIGGDDVWLDPAMMHKADAYTRSDGERAIGAMNELNFLCGDCVEVNPPEEWLAESVEVLRQWQTKVAQNPFPELYVITVMGDYYRATTLTPVPREFGVRGGNAIGRTITQAVQLCAMHAIDSLCALGIPLYTDPEEQQRFLRKRKLLGLVTSDDMKGMTRPKGLVSVLKPSIVFSTEEEEECGASDGGTVFPLGINAPASAGRHQRKSAVRAYLPGYLIEGNARRLPPHIQDTLAILQLRIPEDFAVCGDARRETEGPGKAVDGSPNAGGGPNPGWGHASPVTATMATATAPLRPSSPSPTASAAELMQAYGNDTKTCMQNYLRHQHELRRARRAGSPPPSPREDGGSGSALGADEVARLRRWIADYPVNVLPAIYITGYGKQVSVHNIAYLRLPRPMNVAVGTRAEASSGAEAAAKKKKKKKRAQGNEEHVGGGDGGSNAATNTQAAALPSPTAAIGTASAQQQQQQEVDLQKEEEGGKEEEELPPLLAVGISLKKKDAERACYVHAAALLKHYCDEDVLQKYRAGLPRQGSITAFADLEAKLLPEGYLRHTKAVANSPSASASPSLLPSEPAPTPKPLMNYLMRQFMESGRHFTAPRRRPTPGPYNPF